MNHVELFILNTLRRYPDRECTQKDLIAWFTETTGEPDFQVFHVRDALYRLEAKGWVIRDKGPEDRAFYWGITSKGLATA